MDQWEKFKHDAGGTPLDDQAAVIALARRLIVDWGSNRLVMTDILRAGAASGELSPLVLDAWKSSAGVLDSSSEVLRQCEDAVRDGNRKHGAAALQMGHHLSAARRACQQANQSFEDFLVHLNRRYGLSRATAYLYIKYADWNLPAHLGSAVMKWIVQGFEPGSDLASAVIADAADHHRTRDQLVAAYGHLRRPARTAETRIQVRAAVLAPPERERLLQERERLLHERAEMDRRLHEIEVALAEKVGY